MADDTFRLRGTNPGTRPASTRATSQDSDSGRLGRPVRDYSQRSVTPTRTRRDTKRK